VRIEYTYVLVVSLFMAYSKRLFEITKEVGSGAVGDSFESRSDTDYTRKRFLVASSVPPGKFRNNTSN
jgi:hypothetical protein